MTSAPCVQACRCFRLRFADADYRWVRLQLHPWTDAAERVISRQGVLIEIHRGHRQVLVEMRQRFLRLLETIDGVVWEAEIGVGKHLSEPAGRALVRLLPWKSGGLTWLLAGACAPR